MHPAQVIACSIFWATSDRVQTSRSRTCDC